MGRLDWVTIYFDGAAFGYAPPLVLSPASPPPHHTAVPPYSLPLPLRSAPRLPSLTRPPLPHRLAQPVAVHVRRHRSLSDCNKARIASSWSAMNPRWYSSDAGNYDSYEPTNRLEPEPVAACSPGLYSPRGWRHRGAGGSFPPRPLRRRRRGRLRRCYCRCPKAPLTTTSSNRRPQSTARCKRPADRLGGGEDRQMPSGSRTTGTPPNGRGVAAAALRGRQRQPRRRCYSSAVGGTATVAAEKSRLLLVKSGGLLHIGGLFVAYCRGGLRRCCARKRDRSSVELTPRAWKTLTISGSRRLEGVKAVPRVTLWEYGSWGERVLRERF